MWAVAMCLSGTVACATYLLWDQGNRDGDTSKPDIAQATREQILHYLASDEFGRLDKDQRADFVAQVRQARPDERPMMFAAVQSLSDHERDNLRRNVRPLFQRQMHKRIEAYFELPEDQRAARLDEMIDEMQQRMANRPSPEQSRDSADPNDGRAGHRGPRSRWRDLGRMRERIETTDPKVRAERAEFFRAFRARMQERGLQPRWGRRR